MNACELKEHMDGFVTNIIICCCSVCGEAYDSKRTEKPIVDMSHGYCPKHFDELMKEIDELPEVKNN